MKQERVKPNYRIVDRNAPEIVLQHIRKILVEKLQSGHVTNATQKGEDRK